MGGIPNSPSPDALSSGRWITKVILAVIVGEAIWGLLVSLTNGVIVPGLARVMGGDPQSPVYLGKGEFNVTAIFTSILELCLAGIVAVALNQWSRSGTARVRVKTVKVKTVAAKSSMPSIAPTSVTAAPVRVPSAPAVTPEPVSIPVPAPVTAPPAAVSLAPVPSSPPQPTPPATKPAVPAKPEKPKKPHEVYYNIVGEPINPTEDDE